MSKQAVAKALAGFVKDKQVIGLGSGSTVELALEAIGKRVKAEGLKIVGVPTSIRTSRIASQMGVSVLSPFADVEIDWAFDGADEVDSELNLIKGRGAAMLPEKIVAKRSKRFVVIVSEDKIVKKLGEKFAVPIEVIPEAATLVEKELKAFNPEKFSIREGEAKFGPTITENGNIIIDAKFSSIPNSLEKELKTLTGVVETGLFIGMKPEVIVASASGLKILKMGSSGIEENLLED